MNKKCNIARDLMPLVIDNAASEESGEFVFDHIAECEECRAHFEKMGKELDSPEVSQTDTAFAQSVQKLKKRQRRKKILISVLCVCLAFCLAFGGIEIYNGLLIYNMVIKPAEELDIKIYSFPSGVVHLYFADNASESSIHYMTSSLKENEEGENVLYVRMHEPRFPSLELNNITHNAMVYGYDDYTNLQLIDGTLYYLSSSIPDIDITTRTQDDGMIEHTIEWYAPQRIDKICYGDPEEPETLKLLYEQGDPIDEIEAKEYVDLHYSPLESGATVILPDTFYQVDSYAFSLAKAWINGEKAPAIPRKYLRYAFSLAESSDQNERAYLKILLGPDKTEYPEGFVSGCENEIGFTEHMGMMILTIPLEIEYDQ